MRLERRKALGWAGTTSGPRTGRACGAAATPEFVPWDYIGTMFGVSTHLGWFKSLRDGGACWISNLNSEMGFLLEWNGVYTRRNFRLRSGARPELSNLTTHWSYCRTSISKPVLFHLFGSCPVWFWIHTVSPTFNSCNFLVCTFQYSDVFMHPALSAVYLAGRPFCRITLGLYFPTCTKMKFFKVRLKNHIVGDILVSLSGVFLYWWRALRKLSLSKLPFETIDCRCHSAMAYTFDHSFSYFSSTSSP